MAPSWTGRSSQILWTRFRSIFSDNPVSLVNEVTAEGPEVVEFGLLRGEKLLSSKKQSP